MKVDSTGQITIPQGDTEVIRFRKVNKVTKEHTPWDVATYEFVIVDYYSDHPHFSADVEVEDDVTTVIEIPMSSTDTNMPAGSYRYGLRKLIPPDFVHTEILCGKLRILKGAKR